MNLRKKPFLQMPTPEHATYFRLARRNGRSIAWATPSARM